VTTRTASCLFTTALIIPPNNDWEKVGVIFGEMCVCIVDGVPAGADTSAAATADWFQDVVRLPDLDDRVWDARLIGAGSKGGGAGAGGTEGEVHACCAESSDTGKGKEVRRWEGKGGEDGMGKQREDRAGKGLGLLAVALAHNSVEVCMQSRLS